MTEFLTGPDGKDRGTHVVDLFLNLYLSTLS